MNKKMIAIPIIALLITIVYLSVSMNENNTKTGVIPAFIENRDITTTKELNKEISSGVLYGIEYKILNVTLVPEENPSAFSVTIQYVNNKTEQFGFPIGEGWENEVNVSGEIKPKYAIEIERMLKQRYNSLKNLDMGLVKKYEGSTGKVILDIK